MWTAVLLVRALEGFEPLLVLDLVELLLFLFAVTISNERETRINIGRFGCVDRESFITLFDVVDFHLVITVEIDVLFELKLDQIRIFLRTPLLPFLFKRFRR